LDKITLEGHELPINVVRKNIKNTYLRISSKKTILITTNKNTPEEKIYAFINRHKNHIIMTIENMKEQYPLIDDNIRYFGHSVPAYHEPSLKKIWRYDSGIFLYKNDASKIKILHDFYKNKILETTSFLMKKWEPLLKDDFNLSNITFKASIMKSRFGSCHNQQRVIKLNSLLACFDIQYLEAILLHEIIHLKITNHGIEFYQLLLKYSPNYRSIRKNLNDLFKTIEV